MNVRHDQHDDNTNVCCMMAQSIRIIFARPQLPPGLYEIVGACLLAFGVNSKPGICYDHMFLRVEMVYRSTMIRNISILDCRLVYREPLINLCFHEIYRL